MKNKKLKLIILCVVTFFSSSSIIIVQAISAKTADILKKVGIGVGAAAGAAALAGGIGYGLRQRSKSRELATVNKPTLVREKTFLSEEYMPRKSKLVENKTSLSEEYKPNKPQLVQETKSSYEELNKPQLVSKTKSSSVELHEPKVDQAAREFSPMSSVDRRAQEEMSAEDFVALQLEMATLKQQQRQESRPVGVAKQEKSAFDPKQAEKVKRRIALDKELEANKYR